ncbi:MAG TPA: DUF1622 domain-containing protein [Thermomicrobiales bacterium]|nr:DUF1622 domain-containing protein [Thermomicrobiales bacterium]
MNEGPSASEHELIERVLDGVEYVALVIELLAVAVIAIGVLYAIGMFLRNHFGRGRASGYERQFRSQLGNSLLVGLEILVAADIIRTVALEPSLTNVAILGILVLVRTFLSWSLVVEIEGRWPWKDAEPKATRSASEGERVE